MLLARGTVIDNTYRVLSVCGSGSFGVVYQAFHERLNRLTALKVLDPLSKDPQAAKRMLQEAEMLSNLRHRNLPIFYGYGSWDGYPYIAMEWLDGESLHSILSKGRLSVRQAIAIMRQAAEALDHAHNLGFIHRDLKPSNIFVNQTADGWDVKLLDFGLSKVIAGSPLAMQKLTATGNCLGTVEYMSPEQCRGETPTPADDVYSFGCTFYECLAGQAPFEADAPAAVMLMQIEEPTPPLQAEDGRDSHLIERCQSLINQCTAKNASHRLKSGSDIKGKIAEISSNTATINHEVYAARPASSANSSHNEGHAHTGTRRRPSAIVMLILILVLGLVLLKSAALANLAFEVAAPPTEKMLGTQGLCSGILSINSIRWNLLDFFQGQDQIRLLEHFNEWCHRNHPEDLSLRIRIAKALALEYLASKRGENADRLVTATNGDVVDWYETWSSSRQPTLQDIQILKEDRELLAAVFSTPAQRQKLIDRAIYRSYVNIGDGKNAVEWFDRYANGSLKVGYTVNDLLDDTELAASHGLMEPCIAGINDTVAEIAPEGTHKRWHQLQVLGREAECLANLHTKCITSEMARKRDDVAKALAILASRQTPCQPLCRLKEAILRLVLKSNQPLLAKQLVAELIDDFSQLNLWNAHEAQGLLDHQTEAAIVLSSAHQEKLVMPLYEQEMKSPLPNVRLIGHLCMLQIYRAKGDEPSVDVAADAVFKLLQDKRKLLPGLRAEAAIQLASLYVDRDPQLALTLADQGMAVPDPNTLVHAYWIRALAHRSLDQYDQTYHWLEVQREFYENNWRFKVIPEYFTLYEHTLVKTGRGAELPILKKFQAKMESQGRA